MSLKLRMSKKGLAVQMKLMQDRLDEVKDLKEGDFSNWLSRVLYTLRIER